MFVWLAYSITLLTSPKSISAVSDGVIDAYTLFLYLKLELLLPEKVFLSVEMSSASNLPGNDVFVLVICMF